MDNVLFRHYLGVTKKITILDHVVLTDEEFVKARSTSDIVLSAKDYFVYSEKDGSNFLALNQKGYLDMRNEAEKINKNLKEYHNWLKLLEEKDEELAVAYFNMFIELEDYANKVVLPELTKRYGVTIKYKILIDKKCGDGTIVLALNRRKLTNFKDGEFRWEMKNVVDYVKDNIKREVIKGSFEDLKELLGSLNKYQLKEISKAPLNITMKFSPDILFSHVVTREKTITGKINKKVLGLEITLGCEVMNEEEAREAFEDPDTDYYGDDE